MRTTVSETPCRVPSLRRARGIGIEQTAAQRLQVLSDIGEPKSPNKTERLSVGVQPVTLDNDGSGKVICTTQARCYCAAPQLATDERGVQNATKRAQLR